MAALADPMDSVEPLESRADDGRSDAIDGAHDDGDRWILPSEVDCLGRPLATSSWTVVIRQSLSLGSLMTFLSRLR